MQCLVWNPGVFSFSVRFTFGPKRPVQERLSEVISVCILLNSNV